MHQPGQYHPGGGRPARAVAGRLAGKVDRVLLDRLNYYSGDWVYQKYDLEDKMTDDFFYRTERTLSSKFAQLGIKQG